MFHCISTVCLVLTSRNLVFVFFHSKLDRFECQLFLYLRHFISFTLNSYLLQIEYFLFCSHCIIQIITLSSKSSIIRKQFFQNGCLFLKLDTLFQNGCLFLKMAALGYFRNFSVSNLIKVFCSYLQEINSDQFNLIPIKLYYFAAYLAS